MLKEFKEFISRGSVIDLAIGIIIGAAFTAIVNSLVKDIIMPPIGYLMRGVDFSSMFYALDGQQYASLAAAEEAGAPTINFGVFINEIITFIIVALVIFFLIRAINRMNREEEEESAEPTTKDCPYCFSEIPIKATRCPNCTSQLQTV